MRRARNSTILLLFERRATGRLQLPPHHSLYATFGPKFLALAHTNERWAVGVRAWHARPWTSNWAASWGAWLGGYRFLEHAIGDFSRASWRASVALLSLRCILPASIHVIKPGASFARSTLLITRGHP